MKPRLLDVRMPVLTMHGGRPDLDRWTLKAVRVEATAAAPAARTAPGPDSTRRRAPLLTVEGEVVDAPDPG